MTSQISKTLPESHTGDKETAAPLAAAPPEIQTCGESGPQKKLINRKNVAELVPYYITDYITSS